MEDKEIDELERRVDDLERLLREAWRRLKISRYKRDLELADRIKKEVRGNVWRSNV